MLMGQAYRPIDPALHIIEFFDFALHAIRKGPVGCQLKEGRKEITPHHLSREPLIRLAGSRTQQPLPTQRSHERESLIRGQRLHRRRFGIEALGQVFNQPLPGSTFSTDQHDARCGIGKALKKVAYLVNVVGQRITD